MKKSIFTLVLLALCSCKYNTRANKKPESKEINILWIVADDLGTDLGCYGNDLIYTPNLDALSKESIRYTNLFTTTAVCSPSRSGLITGMYPVTLGVHQHRTQFKKQLPDSVRPITEYFKEAGFIVTNGKGNEDDKGGKTDYNFEAKASDLYDTGHWSKRAIAQRFFSQVQIFYPHRPFISDSIHPVNPDKVKLPPYYPNHPIARKDWALYLETVQHVDEKVGEIMTQLKADSLLDNTIIFFFGDQGRPHLRAKQFLYDSGTNTPLMVRYPDGYKAGTVSNRLVSNIDIAAASLALVGIEKPKHMQGQDFLSEENERNYVFMMRDRRDETVDRIRAVRSKKYKYIKNYYPDRAYMQFNEYKETSYPMVALMHVLNDEGKLDSIQSRFILNYRPVEELYDLEKDPFETVNLLNNEAYKAELEKLRNVLEHWVKKNDLGVYPEPQLEIDFAQQQANKRFEKVMKQRNLPLDASYKEQLEYWESFLMK